ncbi:MAG TPA: cohesin domain-containing protein, partial [Bacteroidales bacterium]|nr:cohesin domain-containing protein [Bacteroidales bacterium]
MFKKQFLFVLMLLATISITAKTSRTPSLGSGKTETDVSNSLVDIIEPGTFLTMPATPPLNPEIRIGSLTSGAGQVLVSLEMLNFTENVNSFTFKIVLDNSILQFVELVNKTGFTGPNYQTYQNGNLLSVVYYDLGAGYMPNGKIFDMKFNFSGTAVGTLSFQATGNEVTAGIFPIENITYTGGQVNPIPVTTYTINATAGANGSISPSGNVVVPEHTNQTFTITPNNGFQVADVLVDGISAGAVTSYTFTNVTADHTIAASFVAANPVIAASAGAGGTISPSGNVTVTYGGNQSFTITPNSGFTISDVLVDGTSAGAVATYTFNNVTANHTIVASFTDGSHTITASAGTGGSISPSGAVSVNNGANQTFTITPNTGYSIANVLVDGVSVGAVPSYTFSNVTANHTIAASFSVNTYTITATAGANGSISPSGSVTVNYGASQTFTISPTAGYVVSDVLVDGSSVGAVATYTFSNVTANHTIAASFALSALNREVKIGTVSSVAGEVLVPVQMLNFTENINSFTLKIIADNSILQFVELTNKQGFTGPNYQAYQNGNLLSIVYYDLGPGYMPNGNIFDMKFNYSGAVPGTLNFIASENEVTAGVNPISNITYTNGLVNPILNNNFTITATAGSNGTISPAGDVTVAINGNQAFTITPADGYHVADVLVDGTSVGAVTTYTFNNVTANHTIAASFAINTYTIAASAGANGTISPTGNVTVNHGANQAFTITAADGYHVADVLVDGTSVGA